MTPRPRDALLLDRLSVAVRRAFVFVLPARLRRESAPEMEAAFQAMLAEARDRAGLRGVLVVTARECWDLTRAGAALHRERGGASAGDLGRSLVRSLRTLLRTPGFTAVAAGTVAVGMGGAAAMFALVDGVLLRPLPYEEPDRLAHAFLTNPELGWDRGPVSGPNFDDWRRRTTPFESLAAYQMGVQKTLVAEGEPRRLVGTAVSGELLPTLGVAPLHGRTIRPSDEGPGREPVVVLSHDLWVGSFGGDAGVVGRRVSLDDERYTVVGVMPPDFLPLYGPSTFWVPFPFDVATLDRDQSFLTVLGRLRPGVTTTEATASMEALVRDIERTYPEGNEGRSARVETRAAVVTGGVRTQLLLFLGAVGLLLVISWANLAGLLLTRGVARRREMAVRRALGGSRGRIAGQRLGESLVLALMGLVLALPLAWGILEAVRALGPAELPRLQAVGMSRGVGVFTAGVAVLSALGFGLAPALRASGGDLVTPLKEGGGRSRSGGYASRFQRGLVVLQVALTVALLSGAGLLADSLVRLAAVDTGFQPEGVLTFRVEPPSAAYASAEEQDAFYRGLLASLRVVPGADAVGASWALPLGANFGSSRYRVEGRPDDEEHLLQLVPIRGDWFEAMGIPIREGRRFRASDDAAEPPPVIVSGALARAIWPGQSPVGERLRKGSGDEAALFEVVGVVDDLTMAGLDEEPGLLSFWPHSAVPWARDLYVVIRTDGDPLALVPGARTAVRRVDSRVPLAEVSTMAGRIDGELAAPRFRTALVAGFSGAAVLLALLGLYGVTSFVVAGRTHEIGVKMALGAPARRVRWAILGWGAALALPGIVLGLLLALVGARWVQGLLFRTSSGDAGVYAAVAVVALLATLAACWVPARRASSVDPSEALRAD